MNFPKDLVSNTRYRTLLEQKIKEAAKAKPIEISKLAEGIGANESTLHKMFKTGSTKASTLKKIAEVLEIDPKELLQNSGKSAEEDSEEYKSGKLLPAEKTKLYLSQLPEKEAELYIPYYDVEITAGKIELYFDDVDEVPEGYVYAPQYRGCVMCNVKGNSMYNLIYPGARLYVYQLPDKKYIDFGQIYLVVLNSMRILKYVRRHPSDDTKIILTSHNKDYDDWAVDKVDIINLFLVKGYENQVAM